VVNLRAHKEVQKTKIVATVGPACRSYEMLRALVETGVDVFRLNFSHGSHEEHLEVIERIVRINEEKKTHVSILADLQGPKLRVGVMENDGIDIEPGDILTFTNEKCIGTKDKIYMSYDQFAQDVNVGEKILVDDGKIVLEVVSTNEINEVKLKVLFGSKLSSKKGVNLPDTNVSLPCLTKKDLEDLDFILQQPVNWIALSFVRKAEDIIDIKQRIAASGKDMRVIAKIEKPEAIKNIKEIIRETDSIMIARGDLGVEIPMEKLPSLQKMIIKRCIQKAKPVIVATQMMESMITNPSPSRAEVTDVANAVLDGADAVMLSGETSVGAHPVKVVEAMNAIVLDAEAHYEMKDKRPKPDPESESYLSDVICLTAPKIAEEIDADAIIGITVLGYTAFKIASYRPSAPIYIFSDKSYVSNTLNLVRGVRCFTYEKFTSTDDTIQDTIEFLKSKGYLKPGDLAVNTGSMPLQKRFKTNMVKITVVE